MSSVHVITLDLHCAVTETLTLVLYRLSVDQLILFNVLELTARKDITAGYGHTETDTEEHRHSD